jgi:ABC-2 type transport system ATP-binding protein
VLTTHQLEGAQELSDRIAVIKEGEIIADLPTAELLDRHAENRFEIRITGSPNDAALPAGARVEPDGDQTRVLLPPDTDERAIFAVLDRLGANGSGLVSVARARPTLEEVFIRLVHNDRADDRERSREVVA